MNNKVRLIIITVTIILGILLVNKMQNRQEELYQVNLKNELDKNLVSILVSDKDGNYNQYESNTFPSKEDYTYNSELSKCQDNNGNIINGILSYNETTSKVSVRTKKTIYCYLYFDYVPKNVDTSGANPPKLASGMIPVYYDESDASWHKADESNLSEEYKWYDYDNKMWANAVTVTSTNRSTYQSADVGSKIGDSDINTMFVWIPRYKYTVWNYNADGTVSSNPQEIQITFESEKNKSGEITCSDAITGTSGSVSETCKVNNTTCTNALCNGKTYTHPAFTFESDELTGFWVGKFEPTGTISAITIKPNLASIRSQKVSAFFTNISKMKNSGNAYGFSTSDDIHMMKNSEWGAVAYLYYSKYGVCTNGTCNEMYVNNSSSFITGNSGGSTSASSTSGTSYAYNTSNGVKASTTGNIYGVYDMSGGASEYTMGNVVYSDGKTMISGYTSSSDSGFSGIFGKDGTTYSGIAYPEAKYYDKYSYGITYDDGTARKRGKLGDATKEAFKTGSNNWNGDYGFFTYSSNPWFTRGGSCYNDNNAGAFNTRYDSGGDFLSSGSTSTRVALVIP